MEYTDLDQLAVTTIRLLSVDGVQAANSGHPGLPLGAAPMAYALWSRHLRFNPEDPHWPNRDRFVLSAGHGSMLLYSLLHLFGYDLPLEELKCFRQWGSKTPGHPEFGLTPGVEVSTGPLGQGFANGVGMAIAEAFLSASYRQGDYSPIDHYTYAIVSDGDLMEGVAAEAASLAGHLKLGKLIYLYDDNLISLDGPTNLAFTEDVVARFDAYGWHTSRVHDGNNLDEIDAAIRAAQQDERPSLIAVRTIIGFGSPKAGTSKAHGEPLGTDAVRKTKEYFGWDPDKTFGVPDKVAARAREAGERGAKLQAEWKQQFENYRSEHADAARRFDTSFRGELPDGWQKALPTFPAGTELATREAAGKALDALREEIPWLLGGSAVLAGSTRTPMVTDGSFQPGTYGSNVLWFGVREHAMGAALNGMSAHGGVHAYGGTFLTFSDYMRGAIRVAALSHHPVTYVFTHDSIGLGEDGPTHQPIEHFAALRAIPNMTVIRPGDANEASYAWRSALENTHGPTALILSRQKLPTFDRNNMGAADGTLRGAYVLIEAEGGAPELILMATGSELSMAVEAHGKLVEQGVKARVVSFPSWELFLQQSEDYRASVLPPDVGARISIEAGVGQGWHRWVGDHGDVMSIEKFGASAPYKEIYQHYGLTVGDVVDRSMRLLGRGGGNAGGEQVPGSAAPSEGHS